MARARRTRRKRRTETSVATASVRQRHESSTAPGTPQIGRLDDPAERAADRMADRVTGLECSSPDAPSSHLLPDILPKPANSKVGRPAGSAPEIVDEILRAPGQALDDKTQDYMESRFGQDFSTVRIHADKRAGRSAQAINALAYTTGKHIAFAPGQYAPETRRGQWLLAHELGHVVQHGNASDHGPDMVARKGGSAEGLFANVGRAFADFFTGSEPAYDDETLTRYLRSLRDTGDIEDDFDSDNKARAVVRRWKEGAAAFSALTVPDRILLIREMASGFLGADDQQGILDLLQESILSELTTILPAIDAEKLAARFDGGRKKTLKRLIMDQEIDVLFPGEWTQQGVQEILLRHGDDAVIKTILDESITVIRFETAFNTWLYDDGRLEEEELEGLQGNLAGNEIRIRKSLTNEEAASVLFHEVSHYTSAEPDRLEEEIEVRVATELFNIRHGLPPTVPDYRNPDGTVNEAAIRDEIMTSEHYNPTDRTYQSRRYVGEEEVGGWSLP